MRYHGTPSGDFCAVQIYRARVFDVRDRCGSVGKKQYKVGDRVAWYKGDEVRVGHIRKVAVSPGHTAAGRYEATKKDPCFIVEDDQTGKRSTHHKEEFLRAGQAGDGTGD